MMSGEAMCSLLIESKEQTLGVIKTPQRIDGSPELLRDAARSICLLRDHVQKNKFQGSRIERVVDFSSACDES